MGQPALLIVLRGEINLAGKKKGGNTVEAVWRLAEPIAQSLGLSLWDVRFEKEGVQWFLRIFVDKPEGVGIDDCVEMSRAVNDPLDELDPIDCAYCMEVCSPGMGRELVRPAHFKAYLGSPVQVRAIRPLADGRREFTAVLKSYEDGVLTLLDGGNELALAQNTLSRVRLVDDDFVGGFEEDE
ncbi:MAG: ribosome maturation factor RimP [Hydrogeniiclostridium mannosilyticum]